MAKMLGRSKSFRMLRGGHKETQLDVTDTTPQPALSRVDISRLKAPLPVSQADSRLETPDPDSEMLSRPTTSSGPGDRSTQFHKKVVPTHCWEDPSSNTPQVSPTKSTALLYAAEFHEEKEGIIGIALGSPTMAPHWDNALYHTDFVSQTQGPVTHISSSNPSPDLLPRGISNHADASKPKLSRWKSIFKKTTPTPKQDKDSFYQLARTVQYAQLNTDYENSPSGSRLALPLEENATKNLSSSATFKSDIRQSRKLPKGHVQPSTDTRPRALTVGVAPSNMQKSPLSRFALSPRPRAHTTMGDSISGSKVKDPTPLISPNAFDGKPLLDVDIPSIQMERYSVMFSGLLQQSPNTSSSLLQRRQGASDKLKPLNALSMKDGEGGSLQRRATSPSLPSKSPGHLSLFPSRNANSTPSPRPASLNRPRPLQRARTAPAISPHRETYFEQANNGGSLLRERKKIVNEPDYPDTPSLSNTSSPTSVRSFESDRDDIAVGVASNAPSKPWRITLQNEEPAWEIVQRQPSIHAVTKASALRSHPTGGSQPSSAALESNAVPHNPSLHRTRSHTALSPSPRWAERFDNSAQATVGIARSVSVSRASRADRLLSPQIVMSPVDSLRNGRFVDSKPLTPTLVELKNRKSQRVQLVEA